MMHGLLGNDVDTAAALGCKFETTGDAYQDRMIGLNYIEAFLGSNCGTDPKK
jgi:hypothetical protein